jgi:hypothetical protein
LSTNKQKPSAEKDRPCLRKIQNDLHQHFWPDSFLATLPVCLPGLPIILWPWKSGAKKVAIVPKFGQMTRTQSFHPYFAHKRVCPCHQGDPIGRFFVYWAIHNFGQFLWKLQQ